MRLLNDSLTWLTTTRAVTSSAGMIFRRFFETSRDSAAGASESNSWLVTIAPRESRTTHRTFASAALCTTSHASSEHAGRTTWQSGANLPNHDGSAVCSTSMKMSGL
jgi:hypothetical protein